MVPIDCVPWWWEVNGLGHALLTESLIGMCECGQCPRFEALCGARGDHGAKTSRRPGSICPDCAGILASPAVAGPTREGLIR